MTPDEYAKTGSEYSHQVALFMWANLNKIRFPELNLLFAIPNGELRSKATGGRLKAAGVKAGVPDICLPVARGHYHALYLEMKRPGHGSKPSKEQLAWGSELAKQGNAWTICDTWEYAVKIICEYLTLK